MTHSVNFLLFTPTRNMGTVEVQIQSFLTSALGGCEWSKSCHGHFIPRKALRCPLNRRLCVYGGRGAGLFGK